MKDVPYLMSMFLLDVYVGFWISLDWLQAQIQTCQRFSALWQSRLCDIEMPRVNEYRAIVPQTRRCLCRILLRESCLWVLNMSTNRLFRDWNKWAKILPQTSIGVTQCRGDDARINSLWKSFGRCGEAKWNTWYKKKLWHRIQLGNKIFKWSEFSLKIESEFPILDFRSIGR